MRWVATPSNFRAKAGVLAVVVGGHVAMFLLLTANRERESESADDERMTLVFIDALDARPPPEPSVDARAPQPARSATAPRAFAPAPEPAADASSAISSGVDWYAQGSDAAGRAASEPTTREFGFPKRDPAPREKTPFAWDKTHTERVHALDGGGLGIRLSDNCELILAPLPFGACALGKRKARGDLLDGMKTPPEMGDWK